MTLYREAEGVLRNPLSLQLSVFLLLFVFHVHLKIRIPVEDKLARPSNAYQYLWSRPPRLAINLPEGTAPVPVTCVTGA